MAIQAVIIIMFRMSIRHKTNPVIFRTNPVIVKTHPVIFKTNPVIFRTNTVPRYVAFLPAPLQLGQYGDI